MTTTTDPMAYISARLKKLAGIETLQESKIEVKEGRWYEGQVLPGSPADKINKIGEELMRVEQDIYWLEVAKSELALLTEAIKEFEAELASESNDKDTFSKMEDEILNADTLGEPKF